MRVYSAMRPEELARPPQWCVAQEEGPVYSLGKAGEPLLPAMPLAFEFRQTPLPARRSRTRASSATGRSSGWAWTPRKHSRPRDLSRGSIRSYAQALDREGIMGALSRFPTGAGPRGMVPRGGLGKPSKRSLGTPVQNAGSSACPCNTTSSTCTESTKSSSEHTASPSIASSTGKRIAAQKENGNSPDRQEEVALRRKPRVQPRAFRSR